MPDNTCNHNTCNNNTLPENTWKDLHDSHHSRSGHIFRIQRYSIHDGPGIRTTVFFQGCPLSCQWCHNPESQPIVSCSRNAISCSKNMDFKNSNTTTNSNSNININTIINTKTSTSTNSNTNSNTNINTNSNASDVQAVHQQQNKISDILEVSLDYLIKEIEKDYIFFDNSGGGVTFSGGEPLAQPSFLLNLLNELRKREIHTVVDTSGFASPLVMSETADIADLILFDLKLINDDDHIRYTGVSVKPVHNNLKLLHEKNTKVWLRFPLIPGITEKNENIENMIDFLLFFKKFRHINILPFHKTGEGKYLKLGMKNPMKDTEPPCRERIELVKKKFERKGFSVIIGG